MRKSLRTDLASMDCGSVPVRVARLVVKSRPPTFSVTHSVARWGPATVGGGGGEQYSSPAGAAYTQAHSLGRGAGRLGEMVMQWYSLGPAHIPWAGQRGG